jgi:hypothetical protein
MPVLRLRETFILRSECRKIGVALYLVLRYKSVMNTLQNDQKQVTDRPKGSAATISGVELMKIAKPIGAFGGSKDFILRARNGELVAADTGDQGGGQN